MIYRQTREHDIPQLAKLQKEHPDFHDLNLTKCVTDGVVVDDNQDVVAYGIVIPFAEAVFIPDLSRTKKERTEALRLLMRQAIYGTEKVGLKQLHCFIKNEEFAEIMIKHYGFEPCIGQALVLNLET